MFQWCWLSLAYIVLLDITETAEEFTVPKHRQFRNHQRWSETYVRQFGSWVNECYLVQFLRYFLRREGLDVPAKNRPFSRRLLFFLIGKFFAVFDRGISCSERDLKCHSNLSVLFHRYQSLLSVWLLKKASQFTTTWRSPTLVLSCSAPLPLTAVSAGHGESNMVSWRTGHEAVPVLEVFTLLKEGIAKASNHHRCRGAPSAVGGVLC